MWPCCWPAVQVFLALQTQWRMGGMGGPTGLDYAAIPAVLRLMRSPAARPAEWPALFDDLRVMEAEALSLFREQAEADSAAAARRRPST